MRKLLLNMIIVNSYSLRLTLHQNSLSFASLESLIFKKHFLVYMKWNLGEQSGFVSFPHEKAVKRTRKHV